MKKFLILPIVFLLAFSHSFAANKVYTLGESIGIVADDEEWSCEVVSIEDSGLVGNDYGTLFIRGESKNNPVSFDFFYTIQHREAGDWNKTHSGRHLFFILKNYVNCTDTFLSNWKINECTNERIVVGGDYLNDSSLGYFQLFSEPAGICDGKRAWFNMLIKVESDLMDDETLQFYYDSVKPLKKRLY